MSLFPTIDAERMLLTTNQTQRNYQDATIWQKKQTNKKETRLLGEDDQICSLLSSVLSVLRPLSLPVYFSSLVA